MALLSLEIFATASDHVPPLSFACQFELFEEFTGALAPLLAHPTTDTEPVVLSSTVTPYEIGALITAVCLARSADTAMEAIARPLETVMHRRPAFFEGWSLHAGDTRVTCGDN